jgi:hypothetical protein
LDCAGKLLCARADPRAWLLHCCTATPTHKQTGLWLTKIKDKAWVTFEEASHAHATRANLQVRVLRTCADRLRVST